MFMCMCTRVAAATLTVSVCQMLYVHSKYRVTFYRIHSQCLRKNFTVDEFNICDINLFVFGVEWVLVININITSFIAFTQELAHMNCELYVTGHTIKDNNSKTIYVQKKISAIK